jgi:nitric oxide reductase NorD protein
MAYVSKRKNVENEVLLLLPVPLYTSSRIYYEEDLEEMGIGRVLDDQPEQVRIAVLHHAGILSSVRAELAFHFLQVFPKLLERIALEDLSRWVGIGLDIYDREGVSPARDFILRMEDHPLFVLHWGSGLSLDRAYGVLSTYLRGLGREDLALKGGKSLYTDLMSVHVPDRINLFVDDEANFLLYKIMVTHQFAQIRLGTFLVKPDDLHDLERRLAARFKRALRPNESPSLSRFFHLFPEPRLARDLYILADTMRIETWMERELPGLHRDLSRIKKALARKRRGTKHPSPKSRVMETLLSWWLSGKMNTAIEAAVQDAAESIARSFLSLTREPRATVEVVRIVAEAYALMEAFSGRYKEVSALPYAGELRPEEAEIGRRRRRESLRTNFRETLSTLVRELPEPREVRVEVPRMEYRAAAGRDEKRQTVPRELLVNGNPTPVPEGLQKIIDEIYEDLGSIPSSYLTVSSEMSGHYFRPLAKYPDVPPEQAQGTAFAFSESGPGIHALDEWDYRRRGYRKRWALLRETAAEGGGLQFAEETLTRYGGMVRRIKRQFERIRTGRSLLRRQKEGDEVDLDAAVEAYHDRRAGLHPSERLFVRVSPVQRDIATVFLIDLSGSTSGWINDLERAALLIMSEALQVLQDRFAIYGFSGRTRKRCELFRIKGFDEPYGEEIKRRISNLRALEYTRLGPPIRYLTSSLSEIEARTRLLITLSDGKPDDYDGYSGDYGIEDTRQALIEAKQAGIHPFCVTIDKSEHSYLSHMYGPANYVFIDDLSKLPLRVPEIYRKLTT